MNYSRPIEAVTITLFDKSLCVSFDLCVYYLVFCTQINGALKLSAQQFSSPFFSIRTPLYVYPSKKGVTHFEDSLCSFSRKPASVKSGIFRQGIQTFSHQIDALFLARSFWMIYFGDVELNYFVLLYIFYVYFRHNARSSDRTFYLFTPNKNYSKMST